jgi:hypothetical protein
MGLLLPFQAEAERASVASNVDVAAVLARRGYPKLSERIAACRDPRHLRVRVCKDHGHHNGTKGSDCGMHLLCPYCAQLESKEQVEFQVALVNLLMARKRPVGELKMVTLTGAPGRDQTDHQTVRDLVDGATKVMNWLAKKGAVGQRRTVERSAENERRWHVHLLVWSPFIDKEELDAAAARYGLGFTALQEVDVEGEKGIAGAVSEVTKYLTKFSSASPEFIVETWELLKASKVKRSQSKGLFLTNMLSKWLGYDCRTHLPRRAEEEDSRVCWCGCCEFDLVTVDYAYAVWRRERQSVPYFGHIWTPETGNRPPPKQYQR